MPSLPNWTTPLRREAGWERAFAETLARHNALPFEWGVSDCVTVVADLCEAMCGRNPLPMRLRRYRTELGAAKMLLSLGFADVEQALTGTFPIIPRMRARRGDCGVIAQETAGGVQLACLVVIGVNAVGKGPGGPIIVPVSRLKTTFAIGAP